MVKGEDKYLHILNPALNGVWSQAACPGHLIPKKTALGTHRISSWMGPKIYSTFQELNHDSLDIQTAT
jgi:hypothetical protein